MIFGSFDFLSLVWCLLMLFKAATAALVLSSVLWIDGPLEMPTPTQLWFAMLVAFLTACEVTVGKLRQGRAKRTGA